MFGGATEGRKGGRDANRCVVDIFGLRHTLLAGLRHTLLAEERLKIIVAIVVVVVIVFVVVGGWVNRSCRALVERVPDDTAGLNDGITDMDVGRRFLPLRPSPPRILLELA